MTTIVQQPIAQYFIADTFKITGRGLVFAGHIIEGEISSGDILEFTAFGTVLYRRIIGVDSIFKPQQKTNTGILIRCENEAETDKLRKWRPNNQLALVFKSETLDMNLPNPAAEVNAKKTKQTWLQKFFNSK